MYGLNKIISIHTLVLQADIKKMYASAKMVEEKNKTGLKKEIKKRKLPQPP